MQKNNREDYLKFYKSFGMQLKIGTYNNYGMDKDKLKGFDKLLINMLTKGLASQKERSETDERILNLLTHSENFVSEKNTADFMKW